MGLTSMITITIGDKIKNKLKQTYSDILHSIYFRVENINKQYILVTYCNPLPMNNFLSLMSGAEHGRAIVL